MSLLTDGERRRLFPVTEKVAYLNAASECPWPEPTVRSVIEFASRYVDTDIQHMDFVWRVLSELRERCAHLIGADADEIALVPNTSAGLGVAAELLALAPEDEVIIPLGEFPAVPTGWARAARRGVKIVRPPVSESGLAVAEVEAACTPRTRAVCLSWVAYDTGDVRDVAAFRKLCDERGLFFVVDGIQGAGVRPIDVHATGIDVFSSGGAKWLLSPNGGAFVYVRRGLSETLPAPAPGWLAYDFGGDPSRCHLPDLPLFPDARRYEGGTLSYISLVGMHSSTQFILDLGVDRIFDHVIALVKRLVEGISEVPGVRIACDPIGQRANFIAFSHPAGRKLFAELGAARVVASYRNERVRIAPHLYNTEEDIERAVRVVRSHASV